MSKITATPISNCSHHFHRMRRRTSSWISWFPLHLGIPLGILILYLCSHSTLASDEFTITNNKLFTHNRTSVGIDTDTEPSFFARLRELTAARARKPGDIANTNGTKTRGANNSNNNRGDQKRNKKNRGPRPSFSSNNHNYYTSSFAIPKQPSITTQFLPMPDESIPTRIHPLSVLKTEILTEPEQEKVNGFGRSGLDDLLDDLDDEGRSSELTASASSDDNFLKNFKDHAEDPTALESSGPAPVYSKPETSFVPTGPTASGPSAPGADYSTKVQFPTSPSGTGSSGISGSGSSGVSGSGFTSPASMTGPSQPNWDHKNVNFWPTKLNSYYGDDFTLNYLNQIHPKRPTHFKGGKPGSNFVEDQEGSGSNAVNVSMFNRVSGFYTQNKILSWIGIVLLATLGSVVALLVAYYRNPPTEVVTARDALARGLTDPTLLIFVSEALRKHGENSNETVMVNGKDNRWTKRRPTNKEKISTG